MSKKHFNLRHKCEACESKELYPYQMAKEPIKAISLEQLKVTDKEYGTCLEMVRCANCKLVQSKKIIPPSEIVKLYAAVDDTQYLESAEQRAQSNYQQIIRDIKQYSTGNKLFEFGAGSGGLVGLLKKDHYEVEGLEPNQSFCDFARENYGVTIQPIGYEDLNTNKKYNTIIAIDVIEHVSSPNHFMAKIASLLEPEGIAIIGTPKTDSAMAKLMGKKWWHIRPPHLYYFNEKSFNAITKHNNFTVIKKKYFYWSLPLAYILDSIQKLVFKKASLSFKKLKLNIRLNFLDSRVYIIRKVG